jgi:hypothetical protein
MNILRTLLGLGFMPKRWELDMLPIVALLISSWFVIMVYLIQSVHLTTEENFYRNFDMDGYVKRFYR